MHALKVSATRQGSLRALVWLESTTELNVTWSATLGEGRFWARVRRNSALELLNSHSETSMSKPTTNGIYDITADPRTSKFLIPHPAANKHPYRRWPPWFTPRNHERAVFILQPEPWPRATFLYRLSSLLCRVDS